MSIYPTVRPSLTLDFQKSKQLDPRISFSRSSSATYVEGGVVKYADEHQARFEQEGLLIEESRTNQWAFSNDFSQSKYNYNGVNVNQNVLAPDGTNTAWSIADTAVQSRHNLDALGVSSFQSGVGDLTTSVYVKPISGTKLITIYTKGWSNQGRGQIKFNPVTKGVTLQNGASGGDAIDVGNGWYRIWFTRNYSTNEGGLNVRISFNEYSIYTGGNDEFYIWGLVQENGGTFPTSYIPTSGSTVTRAADFMEVTSARLGQFWRRNVWTAIWEFKGSTSFHGFQISNNEHRGDRSRVSTIPNGSPTRIDIGGRGVLSGNGPVWSKDTNYKIAVGIDTDFTTGVGTGSYVVNGGFMFTNNITTQNNRQIQEIRFYRDNIGDNKLLNGHYSRAVLYPELLTAEQMEAITS